MTRKKLTTVNGAPVPDNFNIQTDAMSGSTKDAIWAERDRLLDEALQQTFPASDPIASLQISVSARETDRAHSVQPGGRAARTGHEVAPGKR